MCARMRKEFLERETVPWLFMSCDSYRYERIHVSRTSKVNQGFNLHCVYRYQERRSGRGGNLTEVY